MSMNKPYILHVSKSKQTISQSVKEIDFNKDLAILDKDTSKCVSKSKRASDLRILSLENGCTS